MGKINCNIIKDLLPAYCDKVTSPTTNKAIIDHIRTCEKCQRALRDMNQDIETGALNLQDEQIDYLKGYRKQRKLFAILTGALTAVILIGIFIINVLNKNILFDEFQSVDVNQFNIEYMYLRDNVGHKYVANSNGESVATGETYQFQTLEVYLYSEEYAGMYLTGESSSSGDIYYKILAKELPQEVRFDESGQQLDPIKFEEAGLKLSFIIEENTEHVYLTSSNGIIREIWNRGIQVPVEPIP